MQIKHALLTMAFLAAAGTAHHGIEAGLIHRQTAEVGIVPGGDALGVEIHHRHLDLGAAVGDDRHGGAAHITRPDAADGADGRSGGHGCWLRCRQVPE